MMYVITLFSQTHKTWPTKRGKRKLWEAALCWEDLISFSDQPYAVTALWCRESKTLCLS